MGYRHQYRWLIVLLLSLGICLSLGWRWGGDNTTAVAQPTPSPNLAPALPALGGTLEDTQGRFQIGIFDGYQVNRAGRTPLIQAPDGRLAYTVVVVPMAAEAEADLLTAAQDVFGQGEGFTPGDVQTIPDGIRINWTGRLSQGAAPPQPITGKIFARQRGSNVVLLLVAATANHEAQVADAIVTLDSTLTVP